jgi:hypothetical protein
MFGNLKLAVFQPTKTYVNVQPKMACFFLILNGKNYFRAQIAIVKNGKK